MIHIVYESYTVLYGVYHILYDYHNHHNDYASIIREFR